MDSPESTQKQPPGGNGTDIESSSAPAIRSNGKTGEETNAAVAYETAVMLWVHEGQMIWSRYNAMLVANSVVLAAIGLTIGDSSLLLRLGLPIAGIVLCIAWLALLMRSNDLQRYWVYSARELEERYLAPVSKAISRGAVFANGRSVSLRIGGQEKPYRMSAIGRSMTVVRGSSLVIAAFFLLYVLNLLQLAIF
jgi:hypothetical protein